MAVTLDRLTELVAKELNMIPKEVKPVIEATLDEIVNCLSGGETVKLCRFGTFTVMCRKATKGANPRTGEKFEIPPMNTPSFKASSIFKDAVR